MDDTREERRKMVMVGELPDDFLRISSTTSQPVNNTCQAGQPAVMPQYGFCQPNGIGTLTITVGQAELVKNYGVAKMDPYVRLRIGHHSYETPSDFRGGKFPSWNKTFYSFVPQGIKTISIEIFDERSVVPDERVAWVYYTLPDEVFQGTFVEKWIPLSGRQGQGKEGKIYLTFSYKPSNVYPMPVTPPSYMVVPTPMYSGVPYYSSAQPVPMVYPPGNRVVNPHSVPQPRPQISEEEIKQIQEMFPSFERDVIVSILENSNGNKDQAINSLLSMSSEK